MEDGVLDSNFGCPSGKALSFSAKGDDMILACVASLLASSSPVAVVFEIPKTAIASFDAMLFGWWFAHVCVEVLKRQPTLAYRNAFGSVAIVSNMVRVATSLNHSRPASVYWQVGESVRSQRFAKSLSLMATATEDVAFPKISATMNGLASTFAMTKPVCSKLGAYCGKCQNGQLAKGFPRKVFDALWNGVRIAFSHEIVPLKQIVVRTAMQLQLSGCSYFSSLAIRGQH